MPGLASIEEMSEGQKEILQLIRRRKEASDRLHKDLDPRFNSFYGLSRNWKRLSRRAAQATTPNDKDTVAMEFRRVFGDDLFVPWIYTVIETVLPAILASDPTIIAKPNNSEPQTLEACEPVKRLIESYQRGMNYERRLQETVRSGLRYGIGIQKTFWERKYRSNKQVVPNASQPGYKIVQNDHILVYEGPKVESVDIFDFFWDPVAYDLDSCEYVIHRNWRSLRYIEDMVAEGRERRSRGEEGGWAELDLERIKSFSSVKGRGEVWAERYEAAGLSTYEAAEGNELFEVWEYHDRDSVYTVLGGSEGILVQEAENPYFHGEFPFQIYRPTIVEHELVGIGQAEPIAHLQYELNAMRGQRRDAATLSMNGGYFFSRGMLNPADVVTGIGAMIPVNGDPRDAIFPIPFKEVPNSGVEEENALKSDIERTTGMSEAVIGSSGEETATGTQMVQAAANRRIKQMTKNLHVDLLRPTTKQMRELLKQHIVTEDQTKTVRVEGAGDPQLRTPQGYAFVDCGPAQLNADIDVEPIDGSTEAHNEAEQRAEAVQLVDALAPFLEELNHREVASLVMRKFGVDEPDSLLKPAGPSSEQTVLAVGNALKQAGMPDEQIHQLLERASQQVAEPPLTQGGGEEPPQEGAASPNGSAPEPEPAPGG